MAVDERLLEILVCPGCRGEIAYRHRRKVIVCVDCGLQYPVEDDIPVMLVEEATPKRGSKSAKS